MCVCVWVCVYVCVCVWLCVCVCVCACACACAWRGVCERVGELLGLVVKKLFHFCNLSN